MDIVLERMLSLIPKKPDGRFVHGALKEFANSVGLKSGNLISDWMNGRSTSYLNYVYTVSSVYNVSVDWLYGKTDQKEKPDLREEIGPNKAKLLKELEDMSEGEQMLLFEQIQRIKSLRGVK